MRQNINVDPSRKEFEAYINFSGGLNSEITNEQLRPTELPYIENVDLSARGSLRRRTGRVPVLHTPGTAQGAFLYFRVGQSGPDMIRAISGRLYVKLNGASTEAEIPITDDGNPFTFQTTEVVEAAQYGKIMYVATGTKLLEVTFTGTAWTAKTVTPYTPTVLEAIYIGTNGLAPNPDAYVQDGVSTNLEVVGIHPAKRSGVIQEDVSMTAYISKPASITSLDYKWEYKKSSDTTWTMGRDWTNGTDGKSWVFRPAETTMYDIRVTARNAAVTTTTAQYILPNYPVYIVEDKSNTTKSVVGINTCRGILLHWDRLILYKDSTNPFQMYVSDLENPRYFPTTNTLNFDTGKQEPITAAVRFQDMLVVFTKTTVQTLVGKSVDDYKRYHIHDGVGCIAGWSAKVVGNLVIFLSFDGLQALKPNPYRLETMNVNRIDYAIKGEITDDANACAFVYDAQYWLCFPNRTLIYRYYYETNVWSKDKSTKLNILQFLHYGDDVYNITTDGRLYKQDKDVYTDDGEVYDMVITTKLYDLSATINYKKLKKLYVLAQNYTSHNNNLYLYVSADAATVLTPDQGTASVDGSGTVVWTVSTTPNVTFYAGTTFGAWIMGYSPFGNNDLAIQSTAVRGKCRRVKIHVVQKSATACEIFGFGFEFKLKRP